MIRAFCDPSGKNITWQHTKDGNLKIKIGNFKIESKPEIVIEFLERLLRSTHRMNEEYKHNQFIRSSANISDLPEKSFDIKNVLMALKFLVNKRKDLFTDLPSDVKEGITQIRNLNDTMMSYNLDMMEDCFIDIIDVIKGRFSIEALDFMLQKEGMIEWLRDDTHPNL